MEFKISDFRFRFSSEFWSRWCIDHPDWWRSNFPEMWLKYKYGHILCYWWNFKFLSPHLDSPWKIDPDTTSNGVILWGWFCGVDFVAIFSNMSILAISHDPDQIWKKGLQILNLLQNSTLIPGWTTPFGAHYLVAIFRNPIISGAAGQIWPNKLQIWILLKNWGRVPGWMGRFGDVCPFWKSAPKPFLK